MIDFSMYFTLINQYRSYIKTPPLLQDLVPDSNKGTTKVKLNLELVNHPIYGVTKFRSRETFDISGKLIRYRYCWERNSKPTGHITAWENEHPHNLETDPHHHHHVPFDRGKVKENYNVRCFADAIEIIVQHLRTGESYNGL